MKKKNLKGSFRQHPLSSLQGLDSGCKRKVVRGNGDHPFGEKTPTGTVEVIPISRNLRLFVNILQTYHPSWSLVIDK